MLGPHRLALLTRIPRSTCYKVLRRHQLHRLDALDRPTGRLIRRYEMRQPGELGHMDVKKLARIPDGGGHWVHGRQGHFQAVMTDNAWAYRNGRDYHQALAENGARPVFIPPYTPRINGKVERYNRTLLEEWAYHGPYLSNWARRRLLPGWLHRYNYHRAHTAVGGPPIQRVNSLCGSNTLRGRAAWGVSLRLNFSRP